MAQAPIVDDIAQEHKDQFKICKVNVDEQPEIAMKYQIASIPTLVFMNKGVFKSRLIGLQDEETILSVLNSLLDAE